MNGVRIDTRPVNTKMIVIGIKNISEKAAIRKIPRDWVSTSDIKKRPNHQFLLLLPAYKENLSIDYKGDEFWLILLYISLIIFL